MEGNDVMICVDLSSIPAGGLECDVVVVLVTDDGLKAGQSLHAICVGRNNNIVCMHVENTVQGWLCPSIIRTKQKCIIMVASLSATKNGKKKNNVAIE